MFCLKVPTDPAWAKRAKKEFERVLRDHAHCELKAATNGLSLVARNPDSLPFVSQLASLAQEEITHFQQVLAFLVERGIELGAPEVDEYAQDLRKASQSLAGSGKNQLVDRLLVSALIEARSCERFKLLLAEMDEKGEPELFAFYTDLFEAEARHYRTYIDLAGEIPGVTREWLTSRLDQLAVLEGQIVERLSHREDRATIHG